jgi:hypothetical protein
VNALARDTALLGAITQKLALFDQALFTRNLESAYVGM